MFFTEPLKRLNAGRTRDGYLRISYIFVAQRKEDFIFYKTGLRRKKEQQQQHPGQEKRKYDE